QGYGNRVLLDHGNGYKTLYAHMQTVYVIAGQTVKRGDRIGRMGSTGRSTGTHLHFEISLNGSRLNPLSILR
ncbi:MAG: M23 family metallopeptidase, partial [bacterium]|nr:M23 family metallopeptidase [bacterium]